MSEPKNKKIVTQQNDLLRSHYTMSINEKRLLMMAISKVNPDSFPESDSILMVDICVNEWLEVFPQSNIKNVYRDIKDASIKVINRSILLPVNEERKYEKIINWLDSAEYFPREGKIRLVFTRSLAVFLYQGFGNYTKYDLSKISDLSNFYFIRLYEICWQFLKDTKNKERFFYAKIEDLRLMLGVNKKFALYGDFKRNVLVPGIKEINEHTNLNIQYKEILKGKKVVALVITPCFGTQQNLI